MQKKIPAKRKNKGKNIKTEGEGNEDKNDRQTCPKKASQTSRKGQVKKKLGIHPNLGWVTSMYGFQSWTYPADQQKEIQFIEQKVLWLWEFGEVIGIDEHVY